MYGLCPGLYNFCDFLSDRGKGAIFWYNKTFPTICEFRQRGESAGPPENFRIRASSRATSLADHQN